jgi:disulfide bond formation protein DsbB
MTETLQLFFALLALACNITTVVLLVARFGARSRVSSIVAAVEPIALWWAWIVALVTTLGSLYFSEVANFLPCNLCWYQRIAMYPLAVILLVGAARRDWGVRWYAVPMAAIGACISTYHFLIERFPSLESSTVCGLAVPCNFIWFKELGFVTLPYMALSAFLLIIVLLTLPPTPVAFEDDEPLTQETVA